MAWYVQRLHSQQTLNIGTEPTEAVHTTRFLIAQDDPAHVGSSEDSWNVFNSIKAQTAPFDQIEPLGARIALGTLDAGLAQFIVQDLRIETHPDRANTYLVTSTARGPLVGVSLYRGIKTSQQSGQRLTAQYIQPATASFPADGTIAWPPTTVIANGTITNIMGTPFQRPVRQNVLRVEFIVHDANPALGYTNVPADPTAHLNKRNSALFLGLPIGSVLFQGYERRYVTDLVTMDVYTFVFDEWFHLEQIPMRNPVDGSIWIDSSISLGGSTMKASSKAVWYQPYPDTAAFHTAGVILPTEIIALLTEPAPSWP
jgi:hypothetical protein